MAFCKGNGCQLSFHAMGMRTIDRILDRVGGEKPWIEGAPHIRIEHTTDPSERAIKTAARSGIAFCTQSIFLYSEIESYLNNLGIDWIKRIYPIQHILDSGVKTALSTDAPATSWAVPSDPFPNIKCAVTRYAYDGTDCGRENCISVETALALYTREAAQIAGFRRLGQLRPGYKASFAVLSEDILRIPEDKIDQVCVEETYINGNCIYHK